MHSKKQDKPVALRASLTSEASNKRTKVLDDWGHLKKYIEEQFDTQPLLGNIELDEKEYGILLQYLSRYYHQTLISDGESFRINKAVCVALVQIAIRCPGAAYWPEVAKAIGQKKTTHEMMRSLGLCFLNTLKKYKKATYTSGEYVASIKLHTFVISL